MHHAMAVGAQQMQVRQLCRGSRQELMDRDGMVNLDEALASFA
jgi:hypothetical protein